MEKEIIGLTGFKGSGKNTFASMLQTDYGFSIDSFADPLKDVVAVLFNWQRDLLEGDTPESREWREKPDPYWSEKLNIPGFTPRIAIQQFGTNLVRNHFHPDFWVFLLEKRLQDNPCSRIVIADCRFYNELKCVQDNGGKIVEVQNYTSKPKWWETAVEANQGDRKAIDYLESIDVHQSEYGWIGFPVDYVVDNTGDISYLWKQTQRVMN